VLLELVVLVDKRVSDIMVMVEEKVVLLVSLQLELIFGVLVVIV
tara:strand:+ start:1024 stop:1155 length:132 start_codon:yes stop_codon:yes gene_type:complete